MAGAKVRSLGKLLGHGRLDRGMAVTQHQRAMAHPEIDEVVPIDAALASALGALDEKRERRRSTAIMRHATGDRLFRSAGRVCGPRELRGVDCVEFSDRVQAHESSASTASTIWANWRSERLA